MRSTPGQLIEFSQGFIWKDMLEEMDIWLERIRDELENPGLGFSQRTMDYLAGCAKTLRDLKMIPEILIRVNEDQEYKREYLKDLEDLKGGRNE
jgi:hypothetical protein